MRHSDCQLTLLSHHQHLTVPFLSTYIARTAPSSWQKMMSKQYHQVCNKLSHSHHGCGTASCSLQLRWGVKVQPQYMLPWVSRCLSATYTSTLIGTECTECRNAATTVPAHTASPLCRILRPRLSLIMSGPPSAVGVMVVSRNPKKGWPSCLPVVKV